MCCRAFHLMNIGCRVALSGVKICVRDIRWLAQTMKNYYYGVQEHARSRAITMGFVRMAAYMFNIDQGSLEVDFIFSGLTRKHACYLDMGSFSLGLSLLDPHGFTSCNIKRL